MEAAAEQILKLVIYFMTIINNLRTFNTFYSLKTK